MELILVDGKNLKPSDIEEITKKSGETTLDTLGGDQKRQMVFQLGALIDSVKKNITPSLTAESEVTIEIEGSIDHKVSGTASILFLNIGAERVEGGKMKISVTTKVKPNDSPVTEVGDDKGSR